MSTATADAAPRDLIRAPPPGSFPELMLAESDYFSDHTRVYFGSHLTVTAAMAAAPFSTSRSAAKVSSTSSRSHLKFGGTAAPRLGKTVRAPLSWAIDAFW